MQEHNLPKISIVMPVLNREHTIEKAIRSVLDQEYPNLEFIIIDGGSTDATLAIIRRYEQYLAYWHSKQDGSCAVAANIGIEKATGEVVALLMADDWYEPGTLARIGDALINNPDADMITCGGRIVFLDEQTQQYKVKHTYDTAKRMGLNFTNVCFDITSAICCRFIKKSLYQKIGVFSPFDVQGKHVFSNDKEFLMRAILHNAKNVFVEHIGHNYLASKDSSTFGNHKQNILRLCYEHMETAENYLKTKSLSTKQRFILTYWYNDQATRLVLYSMLDGDFRKAFAISKDGFNKYNVFWPAAFVYSTCKIIVKKTLRLGFVKE